LTTIHVYPVIFTVLIGKSCINICGMHDKLKFSYSWVDIRMDAIGAIFSAVVAASVVYGNVVDVASAGFSLNQVLQFAGEIFWFARTINMAEVECKLCLLKGT
jgi:hypothetical protein